ncbi:type I-E CRISPR-associated protein Cas6/Cse3/CasE [Acidithiobacillus sp. VAN18-1]|uniref:Type I-E CRISPR-associated protein Cas6/Cse3/CasE n=1 Tax=Igneacidithiobacillus copahuensis TaxID=2724909 RepID=A0AAE3CJU5_9PROT|nr:type I-E CRISPR-associated protein Cas6/Cse3/CasE [Igneacidithiobacillus copahuensis]MBU2788182.1 type I-E CRISPR-associated protein Cas6/Cse3/CasE [Igneacidithiobacillus copahuensis]MBU2797027.1 type I-E CRISPR-associated protein Cas6/Cse3/CasE [Acidithiobacillus sp. VAN18-2]
MSLIASVLQLDRAAVKALRITDPYSLHRVVYGLYQDVRSAAAKTGHQASGILYADQGGDFHSRKILLLADRAPAGFAEGGYGEVRSKPIPDNFLDHPRYRFKVIVNPTRRDSVSGKLMPVKGRDAVATWFAERSLASWGFRISSDHLQVDRLDVLQFRGKAQHSVTLAQAHVQGHLQVTDPEQFRHSFTSGIGRGRSFGCGLLQIVPLIDNPFA